MSCRCPDLDVSEVARLLAEDAERLHSLIVDLSKRPTHERVFKAFAGIRLARQHLEWMTFRLLNEGEGYVR